VRKTALLIAAFGWTVLVLLLCLVSFSSFPGVGIKSADKYVHVLFHFVFTILWFLYFQVSVKDASHVTIALRVVLWSILFGVVIEMAQAFLTTTRKADPYDVAANFTGAAIAALLILSYNRLSKNNID
jgi:VanZ family protein